MDYGHHGKKRSLPPFGGALLKYNPGAFRKGEKKHQPPWPSITLDQQKVDEFDRHLHSKLSLFFPLSPSAVALAYADWFLHLSMSPAKQIELVQSAIKKSQDFLCYLLGSLEIPHHPGQVCACAHPRPNDRRFLSESWQRQPYQAYQQVFLLMEQWLEEATSNVRGVTRHHNAILPFLTRQFLDMCSPLNFPITNPLIVETAFEENGLNFIRGFKNLLEDIDQLINKSPPVGAEKFQVGKHVALTKGKVIYQNQLIELIQYSPTTEQVYAEPILIIPAWIMKYYILDLSPHNSLVKYLVDQGHTVFMISWKNPDEKDRDLGLDDYLDLGIMEALEAVSAIVPNQKIHAAGYCLGGTLLSIAAAAMARDNDYRLKTITLFAAQVDFEEAGELLIFVDESQIAFLEDIMWDKGYLDANRMAGTFYMLRPYDLIWSRLVESYYLGKRKPLTDLMAWNADTTRMPYQMHSEYLRRLFLSNDLANGRYTVNGEHVILNNITVPIFAVSTVWDHVAPWVSVYKIIINTETDVTFVLTTGGHNAGIVSEPGRPNRSYQISTQFKGDPHVSPEQWQQMTPHNTGSWWPAWQQWLVNHSSLKISPPSLGNPQKGYKPLRAAPGKYVLMQ
jgi:polyhydroxyalkanoate synthase subunit PhaC